ncbi:MAG: hypothetical protein JSV56_08890 [Methanomassiliicoccales archaeon]|nr:MAG: hypothetical protein JSV56_08890 [Methanomassiliicoccales archaeon]
MSSFLAKKHKHLSMILCILSLLLIILSQTVSWFVLDADKNIAGLADINLEADFYQSGVSFTATASVEAGGIGGMIGGIADLGSVAGDGNITISDEVYYYEGLYRLQGVVGVLYDTTKNADYTVNIQTWNSTNTWVWVNTHTDLIPWWPEGLGQEITITIKLNQTDNVKNVQINKVWIDIYTDWDEAERKYQKLMEKAWEISPGDFLYKEGDEKIYKQPIAVEKEWGDKIGIIAMVDLTLTDNDNEKDIVQVRPFPSNTHPQKIVNVRPVPQAQFISIILMFLSFPMSIIAAILVILGILFIYLEKRRAKHILFSAALLEILAVIFFVNGANTLLNLIDFLTEEDYTWNTLGLLIPLLAGILLFIAFLLETIYRPKEEPEKEIKFDISGAISEEEEISEEEFECPACGKMFTEMVSSCPECGAEFEGVEEDEEEDEEGEEKEEDEEEKPRKIEKEVPEKEAKGKDKIQEKEADSKVIEEEVSKDAHEEKEQKKPKKRPKKRRKRSKKSV